MGKQRFARKRGFKRQKTDKEPGSSKGAKKNRRTKDEIEHRLSPIVSEGSSDEQSTIVSEEEAVAEEGIAYKEPTTYDNLLKTLSGKESFANLYKRRQREEEGKSDTEEDAGLEYFSTSEEDDDGREGTDKESPGSVGMRTNPQDSGWSSVIEKSEEIAIDDDEDSEPDEELDLEVNCQSAPEASVSSFSDHLGYKLSKTEVDNLSKRKWKYKWEMPASDMPSCKWTGSGECFIKDVDLNSGYGLKLKLYKHWLDIYKACGGHDFHSSKQRYFLSLFNSYQDILHHNKKPFYLKGMEEDSSIMDAYLMHSLNHIFRTRDLVTKNDSKVAKHQKSAEEILNGDNFLDHGFTRPKVLILLPLASIAFRVVKRLIRLTPSSQKVNVEHLDRFSDEYGTGVADNNDNEDNDFEDGQSQKTSKPPDFQALFGGNNNDHFMIGIKFTRRSIKLYGDFYSSDMIVASPLGLITKIAESEVEKEKDVDYLSSIEVLIIDHADVIAMQNWSHVDTVLEQLNHIPSKQHGTDIMRIRPWYLDGHAQFYRQTIILGSYLNPDINSLFNRHCVNYQGKVKLVNEHKGVLPKVLLQVRQIYERFDTESIIDVDDARLEYFSKKVFPKIKDSIQGGVMIFISSYFEFVRVRNFLKSQDASFCLLGEYTKQSDISRARVWFFQGRRKIMLYTERAHFYHRYKIRGIQNLIIYSLPERKEFYPEIVNMLEGSHNMACTVLFSRFDQLRLERIVGTAPAKRMVASEKGVFVFC
ncbi:Digestive organ expansion factor like [Actinidia chinensis var. chinensis]|uniref:Digestive organ expansion factor like n=1 Tax=Actinidia chinensis var. chinensis TaxID=1590841 RepID=A0A2R6QU03_ACTCC|nr:Digestive organ expansion factor like [Actinidia chinensis var. chinensis]